MDRYCAEADFNMVKLVTRAFIGSGHNTQLIQLLSFAPQISTNVVAIYRKFIEVLASYTAYFVEFLTKMISSYYLEA